MLLKIAHANYPTWVGIWTKIKKITEVKLEGLKGEQVYSSEDIIKKFQKDNEYYKELSIPYK